jgi:hypothetical protein
MSRSISLPLGDASQQIAPADGQPATAPLAGVVAIFDPAMCCSTGVCGPGVDSSLLQVARDLRWLESRGVSIQRFGLAQEPAAFVDNHRIAGLLQAFGDSALPATLVNGTVLVHGRYPSRDELVAALSPSNPLMESKSDSCCAPGSDCC